MSTTTPTSRHDSDEEPLRDAVARFRGIGCLVTQLFGHARDHALRVRCYGSLVYLLPWRSSGHRLAAYAVPDAAIPEAIPIELSPGRVQRLVDNSYPVQEPLRCTPLWLVDVDDDLEVSWHARCRYAERVEPMADPGPAIRELFCEAVSPSGTGDVRYHPPSQFVLGYRTRRGPAPRKITTIYEADNPDGFDGDHLKRCRDCGQLVDPGKGHGDRAADCPWCSP